VLRIEEQDDEHLLLTPAEGEAQVVAHRPGGVEGVARGDLLPEGAARKLERGLELGELRVAESRSLVAGAVSRRAETDP